MDLEKRAKEIEDLDKIQMEVQTTNIFDRKKQVTVVEEKPKSESDTLVNNMFNEAVKYEVANNEELQDEVLDITLAPTE